VNQDRRIEAAGTATLKRRMSVYELHPHPASPQTALQRLDVELDAERRTGRLRLEYRLRGRTANLRLPGMAIPGRRDELWRHTCCELFLRARGAVAYREYNFSSAGDWAAYDFDAPRTGMRLAELTQPPDISCVAADGLYMLRVQLPMPAGLTASAGRDWQLALSAVIEEQDGRLSYWALRHPAARPDFHHTDSFVDGVP
jgi:hypothetical protein